MEQGVILEAERLCLRRYSLEGHRLLRSDTTFAATSGLSATRAKPPERARTVHFVLGVPWVISMIRPVNTVLDA